ncbi:MAG: hypothetical protein WCC32_20145, partial [Terriglobales bacterium]
MKTFAAIIGQPWNTLLGDISHPDFPDPASIPLIACANTNAVKTIATTILARVVRRRAGCDCVKVLIPFDILTLSSAQNPPSLRG